VIDGLRRKNMVVEEWVVTPLAGADWRSYVKQQSQNMKHASIRYRHAVEQTGAYGRVHAYLEFASLADCEKFWNSPPSDVQALVAKNSEYWDVTSFERHLYYTIE
jgi:hypothetical protein